MMWGNISKPNICRDVRGQFLILVSLGIVIIMVCLSLAIANTTISPLNFPKTRFRETAIQIYMNFRQALGIALAEVTKELSNRGYTNLSEYSAAADKGRKVLTEWLKIIYLKYSGLGLNLNISEPIFECNWGSAEGYSMAKANISITILSYGLYNWRSALIIELNLRVRDVRMNGNTSLLFFKLEDEHNAPVIGLNINSINITGVSAIKSVIYRGNGNYEVNCSLSNSQPATRKIILQDPSGIIVGALFSTEMSNVNDTLGPTATITLSKTRYLKSWTKVINITALINDIGRGSSNIVAAECYINNPQGTNVTMIPEDGAFDSPQEKVFAQINVTGWALGAHVVYVRGKDAAGNWGDFANITLWLTSSGIHVKEMNIWKDKDRVGNYIRITVSVLVVDQNENPVRDVNVFGTWILRNNQGNEVLRDVSERTKGNGRATFRYDVPANMRGSCTFTIRSLFHRDYPYDPEADVIKEVSITLP
ncbi:MAG: Ig-like domain-containing protein [Candidatus Bathyarchaeia archaeon]